TILATSPFADALPGMLPGFHQVLHLYRILRRPVPLAAGGTADQLLLSLSAAQVLWTLRYRSCRAVETVVQNGGSRYSAALSWVDLIAPPGGACARQCSQVTQAAPFRLLKSRPASETAFSRVSACDK